jgi:hypothetical protein
MSARSGATLTEAHPAARDPMPDEPVRGPETKPTSWWQTLPGILTAIAAVITALTGLIVALNRVRSPDVPRDARTVDAAPGDARSATAPSTETMGKVGAGGARSTASGGAARAIPAGIQARLNGGKLIVTVVSATLEPFNAGQRVARLSVRFTNAGDAWVRSYYLTLRLLMDGVPVAPSEAPLEQVEAQSSKDLAYAFTVPAGASAAVLRITRDEEVAEIPVRLSDPR